VKFVQQAQQLRMQGITPVLAVVIQEYHACCQAAKAGECIKVA